MDDFYVDPTLYQGRPASPAGRSEGELSCYDLLDRLEIPFARADHAAAMTIPMCASVERVLGEKICKNLFLCNRQKTAFYLLMLDGAKPFHTRDLSKQLGVARLSFAGEMDMARLLGVTPGSVTVLALKNDKDKAVRLVIDRSVAGARRVSCHPCVNTSTVSFSTQALLDQLLPAIGHTPTFVDLPEEGTEP